MDGSEPGIAGVSVSLFAANSAGAPVGAALATVVTDSSGYYKFNQLEAGDYTVRINASNFGTGNDSPAISPLRATRPDSPSVMMARTMASTTPVT